MFWTYAGSCILIVLASCSFTGYAQVPEHSTILDALWDNGYYKMIELISKAGLNSTFEDANLQAIVFVPGDRAWNSIVDITGFGMQGIEQLSPSQVKQLLLYHVIPRPTAFEALETLLPTVASPVAPQQITLPTAAAGGLAMNLSRPDSTYATINAGAQCVKDERFCNKATLGNAVLAAKSRIYLTSEVAFTTNLLTPGLNSLLWGNTLESAAITEFRPVPCLYAFTEFRPNTVESATILEFRNLVLADDELKEVLFAPGAEYTLFAPTDDVFKVFLTANGQSSIAPGSEEAKALVLSHIVKGQWLAGSSLIEDKPQQLATLAGNTSLITAVYRTHPWNLYINASGNSRACGAKLYNYKSGQSALHAINCVLVARDAAVFDTGSGITVESPPDFDRFKEGFKNVLQAIKDDVSLRLLADMLTLDSELNTMLTSSQSSVTLFAPNTSAIEALFAANPGLSMAALTADLDLTKQLLRAHVVLQPLEQGNTPLNTALLMTTYGQDTLRLTRVRPSMWLAQSQGNTLPVEVDGKVPAGKCVLYKLAAVLLPAGLTFNGQALKEAPAPAAVTPIAQTLQALPNATEFVQWLQSDQEVWSIVNDLSAPYTIFAPENEAIRSFYDANNIKDFANLMSLPGVMQRLLRAHVVPGRYLSTDFNPDRNNVTSLAGDTFEVKYSAKYGRLLHALAAEATPDTGFSPAGSGQQLVRSPSHVLGKRMAAGHEAQPWLGGAGSVAAVGAARQLLQAGTGPSLGRGRRGRRDRTWPGPVVTVFSPGNPTPVTNHYTYEEVNIMKSGLSIAHEMDTVLLPSNLLINGQPAKDALVSSPPSPSTGGAACIRRPTTQAIVITVFSTLVSLVLLARCGI